MTVDDLHAKPDAVSQTSDDPGSRRAIPTMASDADDGLPAGWSPEDLDRACSHAICMLACPETLDCAAFAFDAFAPTLRIS